MIDVIPPQWFLLVCALVWRFLPVLAKRIMVLVVPTVVLATVWLAPLETTITINALPGQLVVFENSELRRLFATIFSLALGGTLLYGWTIATRAEQTWTLFYASAAFGIVYSGDLFSLFISWELLAIGALGVIWSHKTAASAAAGLRYFLVHVFGGVLFMIGFATHLATTGGDITLTPFDMSRWFHWVMLLGIAINAAVPPFWSWVSDAYPAASPNGTVVLACFTTKSAVLVLIQLFPGTSILIPAGLMMIVYGAVYAAMENNIRRSLAYSLIGQVGFMVVCVGVGTELALLAAAVHAFSHIVYKTLLLMTAGCLVQTTGKEKFTELNGMARQMPDIALCAVIGGLALSAAPFTSGFVSKSLIIQAIAEQHLTVTWLIMMLAAGAAMVYVGLRYVWFAFFSGIFSAGPAAKPTAMVRRLSRSMRLGVYGFTALCITVGSFPQLLPLALSNIGELHIYTVPHVLYQVQILAVSILVFTIGYKAVQPREGTLRDIDSVTNAASQKLLSVSSRFGKQAQTIWQSLKPFRQKAAQYSMKNFVPNGFFASTWATGTMALWVAVSLAVFLLAFLF